MKDLALKTAFATVLWSDTAAGSLVLYAKAILAAPGSKLLKLAKKLRKLDPDFSVDIRELILDKSLTLDEKLKFIRLKINYAFNNFNGIKRKKALLLLLAVLLFLIGKGFGPYVFMLERLREFIGGEDDEETIRNYLIDLYYQYHAPLPEELISLPDELITKIMEK